MDRVNFKLGCLVGVLFLLSFSCSKYKPIVNDFNTTEPVEMKEVRTIKDMEENKAKNAFVFGTIIREEFTNKGGRATGNFETLIKLEDGETVHIRNKGENKYNYEDLANKKVKMEAFIFYGNIDSDNPEHQSRVGYRIDYTVISVVD